ncbi:hypothetical protein B0H13DRAFT_2661549 [Mycena leptocephala]|nr:hypothetical protein B0H13DRAFT_2661549 [Mycena leptocephala]
MTGPPTRPGALFWAMARRVPSSRRRLPPHHLLPIELWEAIFHEVSSNEDLLRISTVCTAFNVLCIRIFLARNDSSEAELCKPAMVAPSHILVAFHLSFRSFLFERFSCDFGPSQLLRNLRFMREIIVRSHRLQFLALSFQHDLFRIPTNDLSRQALMSTICAGLSTMAKRAAGPVFIFSVYRVFSCQPQDIAGWNLDLFQFSPPVGPRGLIKRARRILNLNGDQLRKHSYWIPTKIRLHNQKKLTVNALSELRSATLESFTDDALSLPSFTILVFNAISITYIRLDTWSDRIPPQDLSAVIMRVLLPNLRRVAIGIATIDPSALRLFLSRHPTIEQLEYDGSEGDSERRPLVDPPLAHPGLTQIQNTVFRKTLMGRLVSGLNTSPNLRTFSFAFSAILSSANHAAFLFEVRQISLRTTDTILSLYFWNGLSKSVEGFLWCSGEEACNVAKALHCIRSVDIYCSSVEIGLSALPWLALLPAVLNINFRIHIRWITQPRPTDEALDSEEVKFVEQARVALPHVPQVTASVF